MATKGTRLLNSILGLEDEEENVNVGGGEQQGVYSNVPRVQAKHSGLHVGNLDNDYTNDEDDKDAGKGTVLADDGNYKSPYETKEGIKQVEEGTRQQEDNTDPFNKRVGVVPDDIANHDSNKGMENDKVDVTPAKTTEGTRNEQVYNDMYDVIKSLKESADETEKESQVDEAELKRTAKRRMLLAGIADAANSFHQAYAYARGIKPMNENKGYAKEVRKELREDLDWMRKNKDRVLNYRAKVAEIQKTIAAMKDAEVNRKYKEGELEYKREYLKHLTDNDEFKKWAKDMDYKFKNRQLDLKAEELQLKRDLEERKIGLQEYKAKNDWLKQFKETITDETDPITGEVKHKEVVSRPTGQGATSANSNAGNSNAGNSNAGTSKSSEDNTPPSKRPKGNNDSTPPSRRK